jgi:heme A synthase
MNFQSARSRKAFAICAWALLAYNLPVILWGAYVRVSFSGDGCGAHWPLCNGQALPQHMTMPTLIELTHRLMTSVDTSGAIALCVWAFLAFARGNPVRRYAVWSLIFLFVEALLGAGLVLFRYVARDQSAGRPIYLSAHLTNTMLLLAALTVTAWMASKPWANQLPAKWHWLIGSKRLLGALIITVLVSITGAVAALGDTLFPASSISAGMRQDFASASSLLLRLRIFHPLVAVAGACYLLWCEIGYLRNKHESGVSSAAARVVTLVLFQLAVGAVNISLLAPVAMQLIHLCIADLLWIMLVIFVLEANAAPAYDSADTQRTRTAVTAAY